ncbi:MAG: UDP-N-acetylglucosamine 2-epimerase (non-hydrolyzing) [Pyrinomonadaceae bacterium]|nr:UDP-N-acetylglucosamine 2-epimerase (non-hydrolyzing) [Pyrinomonadaceae bacterium]
MLDGFQKTATRTGEIRNAPGKSPRKILVLFGTRPEAIKLAPVIFELKKHKSFQTVVASSSQHTNLLAPVLEIFKIKVDYDLDVMTPNQTPNTVGAKVLEKLDAVLADEKPDVILVQGDTTTAFAGAFAAFNRKIKIGHIEAGLRSGNLLSPFPEEANRRLISQLATFHFCATDGNKRNLTAENINEKTIFVCGNTVVDALHFILKNKKPSAKIKKLLAETHGLKRILLTTHRRESFGDAMAENLETLRDFVFKNKDVAVIFPVHPNPNVRTATEKILANRERTFLLEPLDYADFAALMKAAWLIVSDSGGVQEEAPSLGKPLLVLRENTERPEAIETGIARLVGGNLKRFLEENYADESWINSVGKIANPFGDGTAAKQIVDILSQIFNAKAQSREDAKNNMKVGNLKV